MQRVSTRILCGREETVHSRILSYRENSRLRGNCCLQEFVGYFSIPQWKLLGFSARCAFLVDWFSTFHEHSNSLLSIERRSLTLPEFLSIRPFLHWEEISWRGELECSCNIEHRYMRKFSYANGLVFLPAVTRIMSFQSLTYVTIFLSKERTINYQWLKCREKKGWLTRLFYIGRVDFTSISTARWIKRGESGTSRPANAQSAIKTPQNISHITDNTDVFLRGGPPACIRESSPFFARLGWKCAWVSAASLWIDISLWNCFSCFAAGPNINLRYVFRVSFFLFHPLRDFIARLAVYRDNIATVS